MSDVLRRVQVAHRSCPSKDQVGKAGTLALVGLVDIFGTHCLTGESRILMEGLCCGVELALASPCLNCLVRVCSFFFEVCSWYVYQAVPRL